MKALLTSAGFENPAIMDSFLRMIGKPQSEIRALFVPTAAINPDAIGMLPKCMNDLLSAGIPKDHITVYDLHCAMNYATLRKYDAIYFCGGDAAYLIRRINDSGFRRRLLRFIREGGVYVGVSAGSYVAARNVRKGLELLDAELLVHQERGSPVGPLEATTNTPIPLTDRQAIVIDGDRREIVG
ncbi:MAG TPA: Type 1 glutamine amidotransferase-like domain-containing protein [Treponemataceae bacterium]|nr:Type 1 glutamine amidotransferase-like domain-containing protein [Treponemataceae bacterium]